MGRLAPVTRSERPLDRGWRIAAPLGDRAHGVFLLEGEPGREPSEPRACAAQRGSPDCPIVTRNSGSAPPNPSDPLAPIRAMISLLPPEAVAEVARALHAKLNAPPPQPNAASGFLFMIATSVGGA